MSVQCLQDTAACPYPEPVRGTVLEVKGTLIPVLNYLNTMP
jgi:hypothetical protein